MSRRQEHNMWLEESRGQQGTRFATMAANRTILMERLIHRKSIGGD